MLKKDPLKTLIDLILSKRKGISLICFQEGNSNFAFGECLKEFHKFVGNLTAEFELFEIIVEINVTMNLIEENISNCNSFNYFKILNKKSIFRRNLSSLWFSRIDFLGNKH